MTETATPLRFPAADLALFGATVSASAEEVMASFGMAEVLLTNAKLDLAALKAAHPSLRWVQVISAGVEAYLPTLPPGVVLTNASGVHSEKGAEFVLAAALMLNYRIPGFLAAQARHEWSPDFVRPLRGKHAVFLGAGAIGSAAKFSATIWTVSRAGVPLVNLVDPATGY